MRDTKFKSKILVLITENNYSFSYLKMSPSLAMAYSILGKGNKDPIKEALNPQRAPTAIMYLAHGAPRVANASGRALLLDNSL